MKKEKGAAKATGKGQGAARGKGAAAGLDEAQKRHEKDAQKAKEIDKKSSLLKRIGKIDKLPKEAKQGIPFIGFTPGGICETDEATFTKSYHLHDVPYQTATKEGQERVMEGFMGLISSFSEGVRWEFTIFNHEIEKRRTIDNIRIPPQKDGLNKFRQEMNAVLLKNLKEGNNSIRQDKYLTVSLRDAKIEHADKVFAHLDQGISKKLSKICGKDTPPMTAQERLGLLYRIYNQEYDYRMATGVFDPSEKFDLSYFEKCGLSVKDAIAPPTSDFPRVKPSFTIGGMHGQAMYLERVPAGFSVGFIQDLAEIQCNMLISSTFEAAGRERAAAMMKRRAEEDGRRVREIKEDNMGEDGITANVPPALEREQQNLQILMKEMSEGGQSIFYATFTVVVFAKSEEQLEENVKLVKATAARHMAPLREMKFQQAECFATALPLCRNDIKAERLYTTKGASCFMPFDAQETVQKDAIFYGLDQVTRSMVIHDRLTGKTHNGLIFGDRKSGKSLTAKKEMANALMIHPNAQVFVVDPRGDYYTMARAFHGQEIEISPGNGVHINPLDLDISAVDGLDPVAMKADLLLAMLGIIVGKSMRLEGVHRMVIEKCLQRLYAPYIKGLREAGRTFDAGSCPTLGDLYQLLSALKSERYEAGHLADILQQYAAGAFDTFAKRTDIKTGARFNAYNIRSLGSGMKELGVLICTSDIWNRTIRNSKRGVQTWSYVDDFHLMLGSDESTRFITSIWDNAASFQGVPTGIMKATEDLLRNGATKKIAADASFVFMLKEPLMDRQNLAEIFGLTSSQLDYITNSEPEHGLLYNGKTTVPFVNVYPRKTALFRALSIVDDGGDGSGKGAHGKAQGASGMMPA